MKNIMDSIVSISHFNNSGEASKPFDEVKKQGVKVVLKYNQPACVLCDDEAVYKMAIKRITD